MPQKIRFEISQTTDKYDDKGLNAAVSLAQGKIATLGIDNFEHVKLDLTIGPTEIHFASEKLLDEPEELEPSEP